MSSSRVRSHSAANRRFYLPQFIVGERSKYFCGAVMFYLGYVMYNFSNYNHFQPPVRFEFNWIDHAVPFIPWTVLVYVSEYFYFTAVYLFLKDSLNINKYVYSFFALQTFSVLVFYFFPVEFPRELFPIPTDTHPFIEGVWFWLRKTDAPTNCFPSLHVSTVLLSAFLFKDEQKEKFPVFITWGLLIALSTLPTKQHYFIDLVGGAFLAVLFYWFFHKKMQYRRIFSSRS